METTQKIEQLKVGRSPYEEEENTVEIPKLTQEPSSGPSTHGPVFGDEHYSLWSPRVLF